MNRMLLVAWREFASVVFTKGFLLGILLPPAMALVAGAAIAMMRNTEGPRVTGHMVIVDQTEGQVVAPRAATKVPETLESRRTAQTQRARAEVDKLTQQMNLPAAQMNQAKDSVDAQVDLIAPRADVRVDVLAPDTDIEALKARLSEAKVADGSKGGGGSGGDPLLAVAVIPRDAVTAGEDGRFGQFDLFVAPRLDVEIQNSMEVGVGEAIVDARVALDPRVSAAGLDAKALRALLARPNIEPVTMTKGGGRTSLAKFQLLIPVFFMMLMMISVMTTGQYLMTTVVEEKSSRVMEVLLSAVSPMQLMVGKILGHMTVGVLIVGIYGGVGIAGLIYFALTQLITPGTLVLLVAYFVVASITMAAMMAAIGSAVNELREAQTLMTPVMLLTVLPWMIWFLIQRAPNSPVATALSFVPVMSPFVMVLRLGGSEPVPAWQHPIALAIGAGTAFFTLWAAAKIFRIGVLMYGKPPNFRTLIRWVRMA